MYDKIFNFLLVMGIVMLFIGMTLQLEQVIEDNETKDEIINNQIEEITELRKKCR